MQGLKNDRLGIPSININCKKNNKSKYSYAHTLFQLRVEFKSLLKYQIAAFLYKTKYY